MRKLELGDEDLQEFLTHCHRRRYPKNVQIVTPGDAADVLYYILEGSLVVSLEDDSGQEVILTYLNPGEFLGEMGLFIEQSTRNVIVRSRAESVLAEISYDRVDQIVNGSNPTAAIALLKGIGLQLSDRLLKTSRKVGLLAFHDVTGRIARTLMDLCEQPEAMTHPDGMQIRITRQELSRIVSCSREMAGRILQTLEREGLITVEGKKTIIVHGAERPKFVSGS
ncbi:MAG: cAMP-activated global transcriptional regulator CRP [Gammaproteobacteria bacterium]|nr:cAMP-activated global transcriptional regulator CRP [Gammaproteobacteria bacterium]